MANRAAFQAHLEADPVGAYRVLHLRLMILNRGFTYQQVAEELGVSRSYLTRVLNNKLHNVSVQALNKIDDAVERLTQRGTEDD